MTTSLTTNEHRYNSLPAWDNASVYGHHGYHSQQQYPHQQISYDDSRQYGVAAGRQYVVVQGAGYLNTAADTPGLGPRLDDSSCRLPLNADSVRQPDNMAAVAAGSYSSTAGTGSVYGGGCAAPDARQLPDVVGGHLVEGWLNHGVGGLQGSSQHQLGRLSLEFTSWGHYRVMAHPKFLLGDRKCLCPPPIIGLYVR